MMGTSGSITEVFGDPFVRKRRERPWFFSLAPHTLHGKVGTPNEWIRQH